MNGSACNKMKRCHICGDVSRGFNYNGLTCQSCKMFFLRNNSKLQTLECKYTENCSIDKISRSFCSKCRLRKCFAIGMRPDSIGKNTDSSKVNLIIKNSLIQDYNSDDHSEDKQNSEIRELHSNSLTSLELELINELRHAMEVFADETKLRVSGVAQSKLECFNAHAFYARRFIKFCKNIRAFKQANSADQLTMVQGGFFECNFTRLVFNFNPEKDVVRLFANESGDHVIMVDYSTFYKDVKYDKNFQLNKLFKNLLHSQMENDSTLRDLILAHILFKPRQNISCLEFINYEYLVYNRLLRRYLEHKYSNSTIVEQKLSSLMHLLNSFYLIWNNILDVVLPQVDYKQVHQVLKEVIGIQRFV